MPDLNGPDLYALVLRQYAYLSQRVIFLTRDTLRAESRAFLEQCGQSWLNKPCSAADFRRAIQQLLCAVGVGQRTKKSIQITVSFSSRSNGDSVMPVVPSDHGC